MLGKDQRDPVDPEKAPPSTILGDEVDVQRGWRVWLSRDVLGFFIVGLLVPLPTMVITTGSNVFFEGITGVFGVCLSLTAAITSFTTPLFAHKIPYDACVAIVITSGALSFLICTLGNGVGTPAVATILAGFVYAFGCNVYLAAAASFDQRSVVAFSTGSGLACVVGPALYIGFTQAFQDDWRNAVRVFIPLPLLQVPVWWIMLPKNGRSAAERTRKDGITREATNVKVDREKVAAKAANPGEPPIGTEVESAEAHAQHGFGPGRTRLGLFWKVILPKYCLPLFVCTLGAFFALLGLAPTYQALRSFRAAPTGDLNFQLNFFVYGSAQFLFAFLSGFRKLPLVWIWAAVQVVVVIIGIIQLFAPFLTYFPIWLLFIFVAGGIVGGSVTNTNFKVADDFRKNGESEDVRAFAMSYGGLGNFAGDSIGGAFAVMAQKLAVEHLRARS